jgi:hypothetical protein
VGGACSIVLGRGVVYIEGLVGKPEGKRPLGRPSRRWEGNIKWILNKYDGFRPG